MQKQIRPIRFRPELSHRWENLFPQCHCRKAGNGKTKAPFHRPKDATCTQNGYTGDKVCKICGEVVEKGKNIEKLAHNYKDGKCTVCGAKDPNYSKPTEDTQPPQTGQNSNLTMWFTLMIIACIAFVGIIIYTKKKQNK